MHTITLLISFLLITFSSQLYSQKRSPKVGYKLLNPDKVETKNFYFFSVLDHQDELKKILSEDEILKKIAEDKYTKLRKSGNSYDSIGNMLKFSEQEIETIGIQIVRLFEQQPSFKKVFDDHVIASGCYYLLMDQSDPGDIIKKVWKQDASAMNRIIDVYGIGVKPFYPGIDSLSYPTGSRKHQNLMSWTKSLLVSQAENNPLFYHLTYSAAELLLDLNDRDDAVVYEPLWEGENKAAYEKIKQTDWDKYPYTALVVLGFGPDNYDFPLNPGAKIRLRTALEKYKEGVAPFIVVTGGKVYPFKTRNVEAYHMKQYLINEFEIPEDQIIIEPHARHTTSNIRNTARIIFRNGIPMNKPMLVSSSEGHINTVFSGSFAERCQREIGLVPYKTGKRTGLNFVELFPLPNALQINPIEPLDP
jgi:hypothetical protein